MPNFLTISAGARLLGVGSGLGILAGRVASSVRGAEVVGVERSGEQRAAAVRCEDLRYVQGDAHRLAALLRHPDSSAQFVWNRALATR